MTKHWKQKQKGKGKKVAYAATASTTRATSSPLTSRAPIGMNNLPDELLDDIAFFASPSALCALALVEQRWYDPARKQTLFPVVGFKSLLLFADLLLERPPFASAVRHVYLDGASPAPTSSVATRSCSDIASRAVRIVIQECPNLRSLNLGVPPRSVTAQGQLMKAVCDLRHLSHALLSTTGHPMHTSAFTEAAPAFQELQELQVSFDLAAELALLPSCSPAELYLCLLQCNLDGLGALLPALASQARRLHLSLVTYGAGDSDWTQPARRTKLNATLHPFIAQADEVSISLCTWVRQPNSRHLLDWPPRRGGVCLCAADPRIPSYKTFWWIGEPAVCLCHMRDQLSSLRSSAMSRKAWGRQGDGWTNEHVHDLKALCGANGVELVWE